MVSVSLPGALKFLTPSTHNCVLTMVPVTVEVAVISTGELTLEPLTGLQMWTPSEAGAEAGRRRHNNQGIAEVGARDGVGRTGSLGNGGGRDCIRVQLVAVIAEGI